MAKVEIVRSLFEEIEKKFKEESYEIIELMKSLEENPHKGKPLGNIGGVLIKEIRYKNFRFYFITDGHKLKFLNEESLANLLIIFIKMSDKKSQQKTIDEIRKILITLGPKGFE
ncbi:MAG: hypothetical protein WC781_01985 [Candidatus Pacearchaeota archaeon]|jgi:hypothetical protein